MKRKVTEPKETEAKVTEPTETEPTETEPKETEPKEMEPKETEPKETEPKETEPKETAEMNPPKAPVPAGDESVSVASGFSDEEESVGSGFDDESIASGFTESPSKAKNKDKVGRDKQKQRDSAPVLMTTHFSPCRRPSSRRPRTTASLKRARTLPKKM